MRPLAALIAAAALLVSACASSSGGPSPTAARTAWIVAADGRAIGQATFTEATNGVLIRLEFSERSLPPGWHGVHLHGRGDCSDFAAGFEGAGSHVHTGGRETHGLRNEDGPDAGDLPNIFAAPAGPYGAEIFTPFVTLGRTTAGTHARTSLLDDNGSALVIHAGPDDHVSQPIGGAGARIACAALTSLP